MGVVENGLVPIIAILSTIALPIGLGMYLGLINMRNKHKENLELIKQGIVPQSKSKPTPNRYRSLRNGFLCVGVALGMIIGSALGPYFTIDEDYTILSCVLLFLGLAYILFYYFTQNKDLED